MDAKNLDRFKKPFMVLIGAVIAWVWFKCATTPELMWLFR